MTDLNMPENDLGIAVVPSKYFICSRCHKKHACAILINEKLICLTCRYKEIGKDAIFEPLYNGYERIKND